MQKSVVRIVGLLLLLALTLVLVRSKRLHDRAYVPLRQDKDNTGTIKLWDISGLR